MQFSPEVLAKALKNIYKGFDVKKKIEENIFWETLRLFNEAAAKGFSESEWNDTPDEFINQVRTNNKVWSAFRTHRMQNDLASKLLDENGQLKKFDKWVEDIKGMTNHYVGSWLRTEYNTAVIRAHQAADWKHFEQEADVFPNLRWMPTTSPLQDPKHRQYWEAKLTLPINHPFWEDHHPGDRWNCKCTLKQTDEPVNDYVIKDFYPVAPQAGLDNNPGVDAKLFNDTHPYFKSDCKVCPFYSRKKYSVFNDSSKDCYSCQNVLPNTPPLQKKIKTDAEKDDIRKRWNDRKLDRDINSRLTIHPNADKSELLDNVRAAKSILKSFPNTQICIREHIIKDGVKNPEYLIDGLLADRKGIRGDRGVTSGFKSAILQNCKVVVIDLDMHKPRYNRAKLAQKILWRQDDFKRGIIESCYVVQNDKAVKISIDLNTDKKEIIQKINKLDL